MLEDLARKLDNIKNPSGTIKLSTELPSYLISGKIIQGFINIDDRVCENFCSSKYKKK